MASPMCMTSRPKGEEDSPKMLRSLGRAKQSPIGRFSFCALLFVFLVTLMTRDCDASLRRAGSQDTLETREIKRSRRVAVRRSGQAPLEAEGATAPEPAAESGLRKSASVPEGLPKQAGEAGEGAEAQEVQDFGPAVEDFLIKKPNKKEILAAASNLTTTNLGPQAKIAMQSCGDNTYAKIFSPEEAVERSKLKASPGLSTLEEALRDYSVFVSKNLESRKKISASMISKGARRFRLLVIQWNALVLRPNTLELLAPLLDPTEGIPVAEVDAIVFLLQENHKYGEPRESKVLENLLHTLNVLGTADWGRPGIAYLGNLIGTQAKSFLTPNTQTVIWTTRKQFKPTTVCNIGKAINAREKGFIGVVMDIPNMGKLAVLGAHFEGWKPDPIKTFVPNHLISSCGDLSKGLDSFDLGIVLAADWNEHMEEGALSKLETLVGPQKSSYPALFRMPAFPPDMPPSIRMVKRLTQALKEPVKLIESHYHPLLWASDRLGRALTLPGAPETLPSALRSQGFSIISTCYSGGWTYKWKRGCRYPRGKPTTGHSPFSIFHGCLAKKVYESKRGVGFLDRVVLRLPSSSEKAIQTLVEADGVGPVLPSTYASITRGAHVYNLSSDHLMVASLFEFLSLR